MANPEDRNPQPIEIAGRAMAIVMGITFGGIGLAVIGDDRGCLLHFEMQASRGSGRIISLGSMQKVMKESVAAAAQFIKTHAKEVGLPNDWQEESGIRRYARKMVSQGVQLTDSGTKLGFPPLRDVLARRLTELGIAAAPTDVTMTGAMPVTRIVPARPMTKAPHQLVSRLRPPPS